jgi:hypothetical protein
MGKNLSEEYRKMYKIPEPRDRDINKIDNNIRTERNSNLRIDMRPRTFAKLMKVELIILFFGIAFAVSKLI